jgi:hypothetical protein
MYAGMTTNNHSDAARRCLKCERTLPLEAFSPSRKGLFGRDSRCKECRRLAYADDPDARARNNAASRRYRERNRDAIRERLWAKHRDRRARLIKRYGSVCACCGESRIQFLVIDHEHGGGTRERASQKLHEYYAKLLDSPKPLPGYRVLCHNCNAAIGFYGLCPHAPTGP